jgi:hypothetical protein
MQTKNSPAQRNARKRVSGHTIVLMLALCLAMIASECCGQRVQEIKLKGHDWMMHVYKQKKYDEAAKIGYNALYNDIKQPLVLDTLSRCLANLGRDEEAAAYLTFFYQQLQEYGTDKMLVNSAADWGQSDPLKVPKTGDAMRAAGFSAADIEKVLYRNPIEFFAQSGQISLEEVSAPAQVDQTQLYEDNSILRGQDPTVE